MKRILFMTCFVYITFFIQESMSQLPFTDGFESGDFTTGVWSVSGNAQISTLSPASGTYCVQGPATYGISKTIAGLSANEYSIEFKFKASQTNTTCLVFRIKDQPGNTSAGIIFNNTGNIIGIDGSGAGNQVSLLDYLTDTWYTIRLEMDMTNSTYDIYIDEILKADAFDFYSPGFTKPELFSWSAVETSGTGWIDDVSITSATAGIEDMLTADIFSIYPNPACDKLNIEFRKNDDYIVNLFDISGQHLLSRKVDKNNPEMQLNLSQFASNVYFLKIISDQRQEVFKVIRN